MTLEVSTSSAGEFYHDEDEALFKGIFGFAFVNTVENR